MEGAEGKGEVALVRGTQNGRNRGKKESRRRS